MKIMAVLAVLLAAALLIGAASAADARNITSGGVAFVYETINISVVDEVSMASTSPILIKFSEGSNPSAVNTIYGKWNTVASDKNATFDLYESVVSSNYGTYYATTNYSNASKVAAVSIWYPEIKIQAELTTGGPTATNLAGTTSGDSIDGKTINKDTNVTFMINVPTVGPANDSATLNTALNTNFTSGTDSLAAKLVFTTPVGGKTTAFGLNNYVSSSDLPYEFTNLYLNASQMKYVSVYAGTDATAGTWTVQAEFTGYKPFADNAAKSNALTFTLQSTTLTITAAKDSVVRSNPFTVTIQGSSNTVYNVSIENPVLTDVNPGLQPGQNGYQKSTGEKDATGNLISGNFKTDASGKRTIQYNTAADTEDKTYTIKVTGYKDDGTTLDNSNYDKVKVKVEKGSVTISASGDGSYYLGQEIKLTGTNTDSSNVFLFITGPNLKYTDGIVLKDVAGDGSQIPAYNATHPVDVKTDNTWEYKLDTSKVALDDGAYTIYATSRLTNGKSSGPQELSASLNSKYNTYGTQIDGKYYAVKLSDSEYATTSVNLKKPFLSAVPSGTIVAKGDKIYIRGTAEGDPNYLQLYIFGPNFYETNTINVEDDGSYEKKIEIGSGWASNQYYVVIEHPMENGVIDVHDDVHDTGAATNPRTLYIKNAGNTATNQSSFVVEGAGKLQSSNAANALTTMIDSANIDDIYTKLTFTVAEPWIKIVNPGDQAIGSKFTITGTTNLAVDDQILIEVISSSFNAVDKTQSSATSGVSTKVVAGEGADNTWSVEVDTTNWKLDEYTIKAAGIEVDVTTTTNFNLVEKPVTTTTTTAVPTETPKTPGFGAFIALAGLGAVALLVLRRN